MEKIKKFWKLITAFVIIAGVTGGYLAYVAASNEPMVSIETPSSYVFETGSTEFLMATIDGLNIPSDSTVTVAQLLSNNLFWYTENSQIVGFTRNDGTVYPDDAVVRGGTVTMKASKAGTAKIYVRYYYNKNDHTELVDTTKLTTYAYVTAELLPFQVNLDVTSLYNVAVDGKVYNGTGITFKGNTYISDPLAIETDNKVVSVSDVIGADGKVSYDSKIAYVNGGGKSEITVRTSSGRDVNVSNSLIDGLYKKYVIYGKVNFGTAANNYRDYYMPVHGANYIKIDPEKYGVTPIDSNIDTSTSAKVSYKTSNANVAYMKDGAIVPVSAGIAYVEAGVEENGKFVSYADTDGVVECSDSMYVFVPLMWDRNNIYVRDFDINMGISDQYTIALNKNLSSVVLTSSDPKVATISPTGVITAVGVGTATISGYLETAGSNANTLYKDTITMTVKVTDKFTLSSSSYEINIGDTLDINAITSSSETVYFKVNGFSVNDGNSPAGLQCVIDENDPTLIHITAVSSGSYTLVASQTNNGLVQSDTATIIVRTGVSSVKITPSTSTIPVGGQVTLSAVVGPSTAANKNVVWVCSDSSKATVEKTSDYEAVVTGVDGGQVTITAVSMQDATIFGTCTVNVTKSVTGVKLNKESVSVDMNNMKQYQLLATVLPENKTGGVDGIDRTVTWKSSDNKVLTVSNTGLVTFVGPGYATVEVITKDGGFTAMCNFVVNVPVETLKITQTNIYDMKVGESVNLTAEVLPLTATNRTVKWSSSDTKICSVDSNGKLTAVNPGDVVIWASAVADPNITDYITVHVLEPVDGITLNLTQTTVNKGAEFWLYATVTPLSAENKDIKWTSSDEKIATVDATGKVTTLAPGNVTITAVNEYTNYSAYCVVTVLEAVQGISLKSGDKATIPVGGKHTILPEIIPIDAPNKKVTYKSTDPEVATVDDNGVVIGIKGGECDIIVTTDERSLTTSCHITVTEFVSIVTLDKDSIYINEKAATKLKATVKTDSASNKNVVWSSANNDIATVDNTGNVYGVKVGTTIIKATATDGSGAYAECRVQVVTPVTKINFNDEKIDMNVGDKRTIEAHVEPDGATVKALRWESSAPSIATVDEDGEVTAVAQGKCKITAISTDGNEVKAVCTINVKASIVATAITLTPSTITFKAGESRNITAITTPIKITESIAWISSDSSVVAVNGAGVLTGISEGTATITAYGTQSGVQATCKVTVNSSITKATSIELNTNKMVMFVGDTRPLQYRLLPTNSVEPVNWISSDISVATVNKDGVVTTVGPGKCKIISQAAVSGIETSCDIYSMGLNKTSYTLQQYDSFTLYVDGAPSDAKISWRTGNERIATITNKGVITGRKEGTTTITATIEDKTLTCVVKVVSATAD